LGRKFPGNYFTWFPKKKKPEFPREKGLGGIGLFGLQEKEVGFKGTQGLLQRP